VGADDDLYICGDLVLGDTNRGIGYLRLLPGRIHIIRGNHDTDARIARYKELPNVVEVTDAARFKYNKYHFYLSHYPTLTANFEKESLHQIEINLFGHTHQQSNFYQDMPFLYHVGVDSHNCFPVSIDEVIDDCEAKVKECLEYL
jgi:calcineurin-like phosphoesterase family protein